MNHKLEERDLVMCTVDRIIGTVVFVKIPLNEKEIEGSIVTSEIAPGRIRNLRDYVFPGKRIVCKILRISGESIALSLRRVTQKEQKEVKEQEKQEKTYNSILKSVLGEKAKSIIEDITKKEGLYDFFQRVKEEPKELEKIIGKDSSKRILEIIGAQKPKSTILKKEIFLTTNSSNGLEIIKSLLCSKKIKETGVNVKYIAAGRYTLKIESSDPKTAENKLKEIISEIESSSKKQGMNFGVKEK